MNIVLLFLITELAYMLSITRAQSCSNTNKPPLLTSTQIYLPRINCASGPTYFLSNRYRDSIYCQCWSQCGYICEISEPNTENDCNIIFPPSDSLPHGSSYTQSYNCSRGNFYHTTDPPAWCNCWGHCGYICVLTAGTATSGRGASANATTNITATTREATDDTTGEIYSTEDTTATTTVGTEITTGGISSTTDVTVPTLMGGTEYRGRNNRVKGQSYTGPTGEVPSTTDMKATVRKDNTTGEVPSTKDMTATTTVGFDNSTGDMSSTTNMTATTKVMKDNTTGEVPSTTNMTATTKVMKDNTTGEVPSTTNMTATTKVMKDNTTGEVPSTTNMAATTKVMKDNTTGEVPSTTNITATTAVKKHTTTGEIPSTTVKTATTKVRNDRTTGEVPSTTDMTATTTVGETLHRRRNNNEKVQSYTRPGMPSMMGFFE